MYVWCRLTREPTDRLRKSGSLEHSTPLSEVEWVGWPLPTIPAVGRDPANSYVVGLTTARGITGRGLLIGSESSIPGDIGTRISETQKKSCKKKTRILLNISA